MITSPRTARWFPLRTEVRRRETATVSDGQLNWPVERAGLTGVSNNAGFVLADTPAGKTSCGATPATTARFDQIRFNAVTWSGGPR